LFGGPLFEWNTTEARRRALIALGHDVRAIDLLGFIDTRASLLPKLRRHLHLGRGVAAYNAELLKRAAAWNPEVVWLDAPAQVWPRTVNLLRSSGAMVVNHNTEYVGFRRYWFRHLLAATALYDAHFVTNNLTAEILTRLGARRVIMGQFSYDPGLHHPMALTEEDTERYRTDAIFVGHWEPRSARLVAQLRRSGLMVSVYGPNWRRAVRLGDRRSIRPIYGEEYVKALAGAKICLCFLSRWNRNQATLRTFEIPASGGFLVADRTPLHSSYFQEGKEAEFFSSGDELVEKCRHYVVHSDTRVGIARAGHERCIQGSHAHKDEVERLLSELRGRLEPRVPLK
jgi:spore maturation protein CgeB